MRIHLSTVLYTVLLILGMSIPSFAFAQTSGGYMIDDFQTFNSAGWISLGSFSNFSSVSLGCPLHVNCAEVAGSGASPSFAYLNIPQSTNGYLYVTASSSASVGTGGDFSVATSSISFREGFTGMTHDTLSHTYLIAWQDVVGDTYKQFCEIEDDFNLNDCFWHDSVQGVLFGQLISLVELDNLSGQNNVGQHINDLVLNSTTIVSPFTSILNVFPSIDSTVATSTGLLFGASGFIIPDDYKADEFLQLRYLQKTGMGVGDNSDIASAGQINLPISASGNFDATTVVNVQNTGVYVAYASIEKPVLDLFGFDIYHVTVGSPIQWTFTIGTSTQIEKDSVNLLLHSTGIGSSIIASSTQQLSTSTQLCVSFTHFSMVDCLSYLFTPDPASLAQMGNSFHQLLLKYPWGVATRGIDLISGGATSSDSVVVSSTLPSLVVSPADTGLAPAVGASSINLTPWQLLMGSTSILGTAVSPKTGKTFKQVVEPGWDFLVAVLFGFAIIMQLLGVNITGGVENDIRNSRRVPRK